MHTVSHRHLNDSDVLKESTRQRPVPEVQVQRVAPRWGGSNVSAEPIGGDGLGQGSGGHRRRGTRHLPRHRTSLGVELPRSASPVHLAVMRRGYFYALRQLRPCPLAPLPPLLLVDVSAGACSSRRASPPAGRSVVGEGSSSHAVTKAWRVFSEALRAQHAAHRHLVARGTGGRRDHALQVVVYPGVASLDRPDLHLSHGQPLSRRRRRPASALPPRAGTGVLKLTGARPRRVSSTGPVGLWEWSVLRTRAGCSGAHVLAAGAPPARTVATGAVVLVLVLVLVLGTASPRS